MWSASGLRQTLAKQDCRKAELQMIHLGGEYSISYKG